MPSINYSPKNLPHIAAVAEAAAVIAVKADRKKLEEAFTELNMLVSLQDTTIKAAVESINEDSGVTADTMELLEKAAKGATQIMASIWASMGVNIQDAIDAGNKKMDEFVTNKGSATV